MISIYPLAGDPNEENMTLFSERYQQQRGINKGLGVNLDVRMGRVDATADAMIGAGERNKRKAAHGLIGVCWLDDAASTIGVGMIGMMMVICVCVCDSARILA